MGGLAVNSEINPYIDFVYKNDDLLNFPTCFCCGSCSVFLIYITDNPRAAKYRPTGFFRPGLDNIVCPQCSPDPDHYSKMFPGETLFQEHSILNDRQLLRFLAKFNYHNPYYKRFYPLDRIIITENTKLRSSYKQLMKRPLPELRKLESAMKLFPEAHRMENRKYAGGHDIVQVVKEKYTAICMHYMNLTETEASELQDNFDTLIDRTPMHVKRHKPKTIMEPELPVIIDISNSDDIDQDTLNSDSLLNISSATSSSVAQDVCRHDIEDDKLRSNDNSTSGSDGQASAISMHFSSQDISGPGIIPLSSQSTAHISSQSASQISVNYRSSQSLTSMINISSQDIVEKTPRFSIDENTENTDDNAETTDDDLSVSSSRTAKRRSDTVTASVTPSVVPDDDQEAGPSAKRPRTRRSAELPTNPSPTDFVRNPSVRLPRLDGG